ncbi:MAG: hypothetical protein HYX75_01855 [Acidobacteria bacterium]|nr:hypothetical protein [Acidobacteriota bacterium]
MVRIPVTGAEAELEIPEELVAGLIPIALEVLRGTPTMNAQEIAGYTVDVGGRGVAYGVIRLRRGDELHKINPAAAAKFLAEVAPERIPTSAQASAILSASLTTPAELTAVAPSVHHRRDQPPPLPMEPVPEPHEEAAPPMTVNEVANRLTDIVSGSDPVVTDAEMQKLVQMVREYRQSGAEPLVEQALTQLLQSPKTPPLLKTRLVQHVTHLAVPRISAALTNAAHDPRIQNLLRDKRVQSVLRRLQERRRQ